MSTNAENHYRERLGVPTRWWLFLGLFLVSLWLALVVSTPPTVMAVVTLVTTLLGVALLRGYGSVLLQVDDEALRAGRAHLEWGSCGPASALDAEATRRLRGVDADARAFLLLRPYVATSVRVAVDDATDPTPYWMLSTRHPDRLAESINRARVLAD